MRGEAEISHESDRPENTPAAAVTTVDPESSASGASTTPLLEESVLEEQKANSPEHQKYVGVGIFRFRFSLANFRLDSTFAERRFSITEAALLLMMAYLASRGLGVVRQTIFNALFGTGPEANAYYAAARLPDTLFDLIAGGALTHALIPVFVSYEKDNGRREAWRLVSLVFNVLLVILTTVVLIGEFLTPAFVTHLLVPGYTPQEQALVASLTRIILVQPLILGLGTIATAVLSSKRQFLLPALSIAIYNTGLIGGLLFSLAIPGVGIYGPTFGVIAAAAVQVLIQIPGLIKQGLHYSFIWNLTHPGLRQVMRLLGPNALSVGIASTALILDTAYASYLPDKSSLAALHNAQMIFALPVALLAQAVAQAALPQMSDLAASARYILFRKLVIKVIGAAVLLSVPCAIGLYLFGKPAIHILFQHGAFNRHSTELTALALFGYAVGLPGTIAGELLVRGFYALKDARTPLFTNIFALAAHLGLIIILLRIMIGTSIILAIPLAAASAATAEAFLLLTLLSFRLRAKVKMEKAKQAEEQVDEFADELDDPEAEIL